MFKSFCSLRAFLFLQLSLTFFQYVRTLNLQNPFVTPVQPFADLVSSFGYQLIQYPYVTEDGYNLVLHRVVTLDFNASTYNTNRKPVILLHGIGGSSNNFFLNGKPGANYFDGKCGNNFGFCLVASGRYDVWSMNVRGNGYSHRRTLPYNLLHPYWAFSFEQMARYDLPATISYIQSATGRNKIGYVGHSQGAAALFAMFATSWGNSYRNVIEPFVAWAPSVYLYNMTSVLPYFRSLAFVLDVPVELTTLNLGNAILPKFCADFPGANILWCPAFVNAVWGRTTSIDFASTFPDSLKYTPNPTSSWSVLHLVQLYNSHNFQHFDYTRLGNLAAYGQTTPPLFPLSNFPSQIHLQLFAGVTDGFITMANAQRVRMEADSNQSHSTFVPLSYQGAFNHIDYLFSTQAGSLVYQPTLSYLDAHY